MRSTAGNLEWELSFHDRSSNMQRRICFHEVEMSKVSCQVGRGCFIRSGSDSVLSLFGMMTGSYWHGLWLEFELCFLVGAAFCIGLRLEFLNSAELASTVFWPANFFTYYLNTINLL